MLTKSQEILTKIEVTEGVPDYASGKTALEVADGVLALNLDFTPNAELEDPDIASGTLDTQASAVGLETGSISFETYLRGTKDSPTTVPAFDAALRACGMTREALRYYTMTANRSGGAFVHGEQIAIATSSVSLTAASQASECVLTTATHSIPTGMKFPGIIVGNTAFAGHPDINNSINGAWQLESVGTTTIKMVGVDTTGGSAATFSSGLLYLPPIVTNANITITPVGTSSTTIRLAGANVENWTGPIGGSIALEIHGVTTATALNGRHTATVTAISTGVYVDVSVAVDGTGAGGTVTILGIPTAKVCGEYSEIANDDQIFVYDEAGGAVAGYTIGGLGSKAACSVKTATTVTAGGWRYRPIGERTFTLTVASWSNSAPPVGTVLKRRNKCGAYGRIVAISSDGLTITYEPYGDAFAAGDGISSVNLGVNQTTATVSTVVSSGGPSLTMEMRFGGVIHTYVGARGSFTCNFEVGKAMTIGFEFEGLKYSNPYDSVLAGVVADETGKIRFLQGFSKTRDLSGLKVCDFGYELQTASIALNRTPTQKPDASSASGVRAYRHQTQYVPEVSMDPAMTPVGVHEFYKKASDGTTVAQLFGAGSDVGNRALVYLPAVQYQVSPFGDRDGERTIDFTGLARKQDGNDAVQLFIY